MVAMTLPLGVDQPTEFLTLKALGTYGGASLATWAVGNTLRKVLSRDWAILPFLAALLFSYVAADITADPDSAAEYGLILLNACLLFCTAVGLNEVAVATADEQGGVKAHGTRSIRWLQTWYPARND